MTRLKQDGRHYVMNEDGEMEAVFDTSHMSYPVLCQHCGSVYDQSGVTVTARYADCDMYVTPCCRRTVDTRRWKSLPDYIKLPRGRRVSEWDAS